MDAGQCSRLSEIQAREYIENMRWPDGPICPRCTTNNVGKLLGKSTTKGTYKCYECRTKFTVMIGTMFERSHIPLRDWLYAVARMCASTKGISAKQLQRELCVGYKTAWFMCHRIRHARADAYDDFHGYATAQRTVSYATVISKFDDILRKLISTPSITMPKRK